MKPILIITLAVSSLWAADQTAERGPLQLSMKRAVELAISPEGSAPVQLSGEAFKQAQSRSVQARAALLPDFSAALSDMSRTSNLAAMGLTSIAIPIPGFSFPHFVGPYSTMDARVSATQSVFDFASIRRYQASKTAVSAAKSDSNAVQEQVAAQVARAYVAALKANVDVDAAESNVTLSLAVQTQAENQKNSGTGTGIEITRAKVQLANDRQHLLVAQNARRSAQLQLLRAMGLRLETELELTDKLEFLPVDPVTLEQAEALAVKERPDYRAQQERESNARVASSATKMERLPTVAAFGDYGANGTGFDNALPTRTYGISVKVPLFDGGRVDARRVEAESQYRAEKVRTNDLKEQIDLDVRLALDGLRSAADEVTVAKEGLDLAGNELTQARRRYEGGVTNSIEVTDAQTRLERARDNQTAALFNYNLARIDLAQAMGKVRETL